MFQFCFSYSELRQRRTRCVRLQCTDLDVHIISCDLLLALYHIQIFEAVEENVKSIMGGFNGTILAYGQTSSGKNELTTG